MVRSSFHLKLHVYRQAACGSTWRSASQKAEYVIKFPWLPAFKNANALFSTNEAFWS